MAVEFTSFDDITVLDRGGTYLPFTYKPVCGDIGLLTKNRSNQPHHRRETERYYTYICLYRIEVESQGGIPHLYTYCHTHHTESINPPIR